MEELKKLIRRDWRHLGWLAATFFFAIILGRYLQQSQPQLIAKFGKDYFKKFEQLADLIKGQPLWMEVMIIWFNNITASVTAILSGIFLPVLPILSLMANGLMIGVFQVMVKAQQGMSMTRFYLGLIPHGILELPAFFIAVGLGVRFGFLPYRLIWQRHMSKQRKPLLRIFLREASLYLSLITFMLLVAALFEVTVSPLFLR
ncbi:MAG TPA: stage II sporulation protein M [Bacillota bacterium]